MNGSDPFLLAQEETDLTLRDLRTLQKNAAALIQQNGGIPPPANRTKTDEMSDLVRRAGANCVRLEDCVKAMQECVETTRRNPASFRLTEDEVQRRHTYITQTRVELQRITQELINLATGAGRMDVWRRGQDEERNDAPVAAPAKLIGATGKKDPLIDSIRANLDGGASSAPPPRIVPPASAASSTANGRPGAKAQAKRGGRGDDFDAFNEPYDESMARDSQQFHKVMQQTHAVREEQEEALTVLHGGVVGIRTQAQDIRRELEEQDILIDQLDESTTTLQSKLKQAQRRVDEVLKSMNDGTKTCLIVTLIVIILILLLLLFL